MTEAAEFAISFEDLSVSQRSGAERRRVLGHVTGCVRSGEVLTVVGPSALTSLLLEAIMGNNRNMRVGGVGDGNSVSGTITWNGQAPRDVDKRVLAFVEASATQPLSPSEHPQGLSCREVLWFTIRVRVAFLPTPEQSQMVDQVLDMFGLTEIAECPVEEMSKIQQRLLKIAREVVGCAGILLLHEPTNGLTPLESKYLLGVLSRLGRHHGYAIILTLPTIPPGTLGQLQSLILLASDGRTLFQGPAARAEVFFSMHGVQRSADLSLADLLTHQIEELPGVQKDSLVIAAADSDAAKAARRSAVQIRTGQVMLPALIQKGKMPQLERGDLRWLVAMLDLEWRLVLNDNNALQRYVLNPLLLGSALGLFTFQLPHDPTGFQEGLGVCVLILSWFLWESRVMSSALEDRMLWAEVKVGRITLLALTLAALYGELLLRRTVPALLFGFSANLFSGLSTDFGGLLSFLLVVVVGCWALSALQLAIWISLIPATQALPERTSGVVKSHVTWGIIAALYLVGGFPVFPIHVPYWFRWLRWLSPFSYAVDAFAQTLNSPAAQPLGFPQVNVILHMFALFALSAFYLGLSILAASSEDLADLIAAQGNPAPSETQEQSPIDGVMSGFQGGVDYLKDVGSSTLNSGLQGFSQLKPSGSAPAAPQHPTFKDQDQQERYQQEFV